MCVGDQGTLNQRRPPTPAPSPSPTLRGISGAVRDPQFWQDVGGNVNRTAQGLTAGVLGAPVDIASAAVRPFAQMAGRQMPPEGVVGSTEWFGEKMGHDTQSIPWLAGSFGPVPDAGDAMRMASMSDKALPLLGMAGATVFQGSPHRFAPEPGVLPSQRLRLRSNHKPFDVLQNPTMDERRAFTQSIRMEYKDMGWNVDAGPLTRSTRDEYGNEWVWPSHSAAHSGAEPEISRLVGGRSLNQNNRAPDNPLPDAPYGRLRDDKIGTGEGTQIRGHGHYLADEKRVAQEYRNANAEIFSGHDAMDYLLTTPAARRSDAARYLDEEWAPAQSNRVPPRGHAREMLETAQRDPEVIRLTNEIDALEARGLGPGDDAYDALASDLVDRIQIGRGHLYTVDLPDEHIARMLTLDNSLNQQPPAVKEALRNLDLGILDNPRAWDEMTGDMLVKRLERELGGEPEEISAMLREAGIPGSRFLDQGSRAPDADSETWNYVLFDPSLARILGVE